MYRSTKELSVEKIVEHPCLEEWRERIKRAEENGGFDLQDEYDAGSWDTCAVGTATKIGWKTGISLGFDYGNFSRANLDDKLNELGNTFADYIKEGSTNFIGALETIDKIETRLIILGKE